MVRPFADAARDYASRGLVPIPLGGDDGKKPLVTFGNWKGPPAPRHLNRLIGKFTAANIGILCGPPGPTVVDVDDPRLFDVAISRFGLTPLIVETPSGRWHLYYATNGEPCSNLRSEGLAIDVKGRGGLIVAPPSVRFSGPHEGKGYRFAAGTYDDLSQLPMIRPGSMPVAGLGRTGPWRHDDPSFIPVGRRNNFIFRNALRLAWHVDSVDNLIDALANLNQAFPEPLSHTEVLKTVTSAWKTHCEGKNWCGQEQKAAISVGEAAQLFPCPDALALLVHLRLSHGARQERSFALSAKAMSKTGPLAGWDRRRIERARQFLIERRFLEQLRVGGSGPGDASQFCLCSEGDRIAPQYNQTPSPPAYRATSTRVD